MNGAANTTQRSMFPVTFELAPADCVLLEELMTDLHQLGYMIEPFGKNTFVIQGTPADVEQGNEKTIIEKLLEQYKHFSSDLKFSKREKLIRSLAKQQAIKPGQQLTEKEMQALVNDLFNCNQVNSHPMVNPLIWNLNWSSWRKCLGDRRSCFKKTRSSSSLNKIYCLIFHIFAVHN